MAAMAERALEVFPAGSNGEFNLPPDLVRVVDRGEGCRLWDSEGREYLDFSMGWGSVLVGHARPEVVEAMAAQAARGANFATVTAASLALAEEIRSAAPFCERLRFCASGTEATMYCQRLARAATGRPKLLKFEGAYHGANEVGVTSLFPQSPPPFPQPDLTGGGLKPLVGETLLVAPFNDLATTTRIVEENAAALAGIIVEPLQRCTPPAPGFLEGLRALADRHALVLVFDEVVTGFRLAYGGAAEYYGVRPDLAAYGKALGGGAPIGAFGGRAEILDLVREDRLGAEDYVWTASTLGGNPVSCAAGLAALKVFRQPGTYARLHDLGRRLRAGLAAALERHGVPAQVIGDGPLGQVVFSDRPVTDYRSTVAGDPAKGRALMLGLFERGIWLNPMGTKLYLSVAHDAAAVDAFLDRFEDVLAGMC